ncbi:hypothetical protein K435DRAFT_806730 [Dendrothele bispora CBS 962.96]|uniref:Uncharacterized protein n=1 Tax=Dendrothele bispora (strain CBS 962.96) TaxID=1314807 RepID=A0A4S8L6U7_DENBC|nr:hypothetical protein K435DRAFT_806730 [Dendrothele bispora CBS 962.96]
MSYTDQLGSPESINDRHLTNRNTNRYSVTTLFSMVAEQDVEVEDYLARDLKGKIFAQFKNNVVLKRDVRYRTHRSLFLFRTEWLRMNNARLNKHSKKSTYPDDRKLQQ